MARKAVQIPHSRLLEFIKNAAKEKPMAEAVSDLALCYNTETPN